MRPYEHVRVDDFKIVYLNFSATYIKYGPEIILLTGDINQ